MKYCRSYVQPDTRPGIVFNKHGICPACRFAEQNDNIDWEARHRELENLAEYAKSTNVSGYDCVVALSADKACSPVSLYGATKLASEKFIHLRQLLLR